MLPKTAATLFVHFKNAATGALLYVMKEKTVGEGENARTELVRKTDEDGKEMPIGATVYTPGSKSYRTASNMNATANFKGGKKEMTGEKFDQQQVDLLARTTIKFHHVDDGKGGNVNANNFEAARAWYDADENVAYREQVAEEQADLGKSLIQPVKG